LKARRARFLSSVLDDVRNSVLVYAAYLRRGAPESSIVIPNSFNCEDAV
jgi:hypothetical protein